MTIRKILSGDQIAHLLVGACGCVCIALLAGIFYTLVNGAMLAMDQLGWGFLTSSQWNPATGQFGMLSSLYGTLVSTAIALVLAVPVALGTALFLVELAPRWLAGVVGEAIELLAAVPSIIFGMWGLFVLAPLMADYVGPALGVATFGLPLFSGPPMGIGMLTAGIILALMILPFITSVSRDVLAMVPDIVHESGYGMGATTWEVVAKISIPHGLPGILGGVLLGLGRALGETMAVTFVIGNSHRISASLLAPANTISSTMANEFTEAADPLYLSALIELGLVLLVVTFGIQAVARLWLYRVERKMGKRT